MIRVTVEVLPGGNEDEARELARLEMWNVWQESSKDAVYLARLTGETTTTRAKVQHHRPDGALPLVRSAFNALVTPTDSEDER